MFLNWRGGLSGGRRLVEPVRELVEALDRIPLAIEAVASLDTVLSPAELAERLGRAGGVLGLVEQVGDDRLLDRLERTLGRTWRGLTEPEGVTLAESACWGGASWPTDRAGPGTGAPCR